MSNDPSLYKWAKNNPHSALTINHQPLQNFINRYVHTNSDGINMVHYSKVTEEDKQKLANYIIYLSKIPILNYRRNEQMAFWINLYNAITLQVVLEHYPVKSIKDIKLHENWISQFIYPGPWNAQLISVDNTMLSLNDIEHNIVRKIYKDPRIHYALNCASIGCPNLQLKVYDGKNIDSQLDKAAKEYINNPRGVSFQDGKLIVSSIYTWYSEDFGTTETAIMNHLKYYAKPKLKEQLNKFSHIDGYKYDWSLNGD